MISSCNTIIDRRDHVQYRGSYVYSLFFSDGEPFHYGTPAHCHIQSISHKLHSIKHHAIKSCLAIKYWYMRKEKQDCIAEMREVVRLLANEYDQCVTSLENVVRVINTLEEDKHLKSELQEKLKIISS